MVKKYVIGISLLFMLGWGTPRAAAGKEQQRQIVWDGLSAIVGQKVRIVMPDGGRIEGTVQAVELDALAVEIHKTSNRVSYPKGKFLAPRATLTAVDVVERPTKRWRILGVAVGSVAGTFFAILSVNSAKSSGVGALAVTFGAVAVGTPVVGYLLGNAADRRTTTYVITR
jgi:hypothetical protein